MDCVNVHCPRCDSALVYRHGKKPARLERFRCRECRCVFQLTCTYQARKSGVKVQIVDMARTRLSRKHG
ncbi:IS1 family transposase [Salmonella enterica]|nr:IS1 family transposase [Salmonella enterica]EHT8580901.1 IS1 family transposase [Salmonella enterica]EIV2878250.1 IS1 family transposase [Salmonella enterica]